MSYESIYIPVFQSFKEAQGYRFFNLLDQHCVRKFLDFLAVVSLNKL